MFPIGTIVRFLPTSKMDFGIVVPISSHLKKYNWHIKNNIFVYWFNSEQTYFVGAKQLRKII